MKRLMLLCCAMLIGCSTPPNAICNVAVAICPDAGMSVSENDANFLSGNETGVDDVATQDVVQIDTEVPSQLDSGIPAPQSYCALELVCPKEHCKHPNCCKKKCENIQVCVFPDPLGEVKERCDPAHPWVWIDYDGAGNEIIRACMDHRPCTNGFSHRCYWP